MDDRSAAPGPVPARLVIGSIIALWACYFVLATVRGWVIGYDLDWAMVSRRIAVTLGSMAAMALLWPLLHLLRRRSLGVMAAVAMLAALPVSVLLAAINIWIFADIQSQCCEDETNPSRIDIRRDSAGNLLVDIDDPARPKAPPPAPPMIKPGASAKSVILIKTHKVEGEESQLYHLTELSISRYFLLLAWSALYLALASAELTRAAERREGEYRRAAKAAELRSLRYQINPHFLFNTLNSLSALVLSGRSQAAERMIQTLSTFYRRSLAEDPTADHTLAEEFAMQTLYLEIEKVRFPDRLVMQFAIPEALKDCLVPGMILQPLVENSVKYAVAPSRSPVEITISAREEAGMLLLCVADNGPGGSADEASGTGIGLANVRERLEARFGKDAHVLSAATEGGYRTKLRMPLVRANG